MNKKTIVVVLGMHRSGTSCLTGSLQEAGLCLGDVVTSAPFNKKGNRENKTLYQLHEKVLNSAGGSWDNPVVIKQWKKEHQDELSLLVQSYNEYDLWGFKDPRALFTIQGWLDLADEFEFSFVASFRHPSKVAASLMHRNKFSKEESFKLWEVYNLRLLSLMENRKIHLINFDQNKEDYQARMEYILPIVMKGQNIDSSFSFYEDGLINQNKIEELPVKIQGIYNELVIRSNQS
ncbi:MAG: hypothetical protein HRT72_10390 [Flavobacteriales bacterium]|nr:hypothetical protein [Flavobacteriales bacterium]